MVVVVVVVVVITAVSCVTQEMTVKGLEPEIQRLIAQHKTELKKIKSIHEAELLESDERASQRYVRQIEELRDQLAAEKESACARERQLAKESYVPLVCKFSRTLTLSHPKSRVRTDPGKVWTVMECNVEIFKALRSLENDHRFGKV